MVGVDHATFGVGAHPAPADEVRVAVDHQDLLGARGLEDLVHGALRQRDVLAVVLALRVIHPSDRDAVLIGYLGGDRHSVLRHGQQL